MPGPDLQLTPISTRTGYQPPNFFGDQFKLTLDLPYLPSQIGWSALTGNGQVLNLGHLLPGCGGDVNDSFTSACAAVTRAQGNALTLDPRVLANSFNAAADSTVWDTIYGLMRSAGPSLWPSVPGTQTNVVTGQPVSIGKIDPAGTFVPTSPSGVIAGTGIPSPAISLGRKFGFASDPDVHLYLYVDKDAYADKPNYLFSGGGIGLEGKTSSGNPVKLRFGAGRDTAGGGAGFITIQTGPDYLHQSPGR